MSDTVLIVCTANVCRSPLAAHRLARALTGSALGAVEVVSAGTRAQEGAAMCAVSAQELDPLDAAAAAGHRAQRITGDLVRAAGLVLTMERAQRSVAVQAAPGSQAKVFTLREAEALLGVLAEQGRRVPPELAAVAAALHGVRGSVPLGPVEAVKRHWWSRPTQPEDPMTIEDGHGLTREEHTAAVARVHATADRVGAALVALTRG